MGEEYIARHVARDKETDIALIKIDPQSPLPPIAFGTWRGSFLGNPWLPWAMPTDTNTRLHEALSAPSIEPCR